MNNVYLPYNPIKGKAFRLYFSTVEYNGHQEGQRFTNFPFAEFPAASDFVVSKDAAAYAQVSNAPVDTSLGRGYVDLTATEMNADVVMFAYNYDFNQGGVNGFHSVHGNIIIYTAPDELAVMPDKDASLVDKITFIFQYFRNRRTVTATESKLYKEDETTELGSSVLDDDGTTFDKGEFK